MRKTTNQKEVPPRVDVSSYEFLEQLRSDVELGSDAPNTISQTSSEEPARGASSTWDHK